MTEAQRDETALDYDELLVQFERMLTGDSQDIEVLKVKAEAVMRVLYRDFRKWVLKLEHREYIAEIVATKFRQDVYSEIEMKGRHRSSTTASENHVALACMKIGKSPGWYNLLAIWNGTRILIYCWFPRTQQSKN